MKRSLKKMAAMLCAAAVLSNIPAVPAQAAVTSAQAIAQGIDVSKYQGAIDWASVASQGYTFAFVKLGSSKSGIDPYFVPNMIGATSAGLRTGAYVYSYASTVEGAVAEATMAVNALQDMPISFPVVFDIEDEAQKGLTPMQQQELVNAFCTIVESAGYYPMVYASKNWYLNRLGPVAYDQWVAQYADACDYPLPFSVWQATSNGAVAGIATRVDIDYLYKDYSQEIIQTGWVMRKGFNCFYENWHMKTGWIFYADAIWYTDAQGHMVTGWQDIDNNGTRRYFAPEGPMAVGITKVDDNFYYFAPDGIMQIGWQNIGGLRYLLSPEGIMQFGWYNAPEGTYYFAENGAMTTGWTTLADQKTYYFDPQGILSRAVFVVTDGAKFYVDADGSMVRGFRNINGANYYFAPDGVMQTGFFPIDGKFYYFDQEGVMQIGWQAIQGQKFFFDPASGIMQTGLISDGMNWYYLAPNGAATAGWQDVDGKRYHFDETTNAMSINTFINTNGAVFYVGGDGTIQTGWQIIEGRMFYFDPASGIMQTGLISDGVNQYYLGADGAVTTGWQNVNGVVYYFQEDGSMAVNAILVIDGVPYQFDGNGIGAPVIAPVVDPSLVMPEAVLPVQ